MLFEVACQCVPHLHGHRDHRDHHHGRHRHGHRHDLHVLRGVQTLFLSYQKDLR